MTNYTFSTLNDKEFEVICRDLLNAKYNLGLQNFRISKDKGVDLRFSTPKNNNAIVVQAKHYIGSKFSNLKFTLKNTELKNLKNLNPERYIIVTSLALSAAQKDELKEILKPYIQTANDIFGQEDLNSILSNYPEIEKKYFKLWFSSITVFNTVLHNAIEGRTKYLLESIKKKISYFVITKKLDDANKILNKQKLLLITGQPGIGKTTLAEIMLFDKAKNGYKIYKVENIREAEDVMSSNSEEKQVFYFDDFLGANYFEIISIQKTETQLTGFIDRVKNTSNKFLILTTRTVILNHAIEKYEKIGHSRLAAHQFEIKLEDYTRYEKALILYNRLFFQGIKNEILGTIIKKKFYLSIIEHKNFTPRIIEFITDLSRIGNFTSLEYKQFIINNLNNPKEIWAYSYNNQIDYLDRCLLITLFSFSNPISETILFQAYESRLLYERVQNNQIIKISQFYDSVKILLNGFIRSTIADQEGIRLYNFINPSLADYLIGLVNESYAERKGIISGLRFAEQLSQFDPNKNTIPLEENLQKLLLQKIEKSEISFDNPTDRDPNIFNAKILEIAITYCRNVKPDTVLIKHLSLIDLNTDIHNIYKLLYTTLNSYEGKGKFKDFITLNPDIIETVIGYIDDFNEAINIPLLFSKYNLEYVNYIKTDNGILNITTIINYIREKQEYEIRNNQIYEISSMDQVEDRYHNLRDQYEQLKKILLPNNIEKYDYEFVIDESYWNDIIDNNNMEAAKDEYLDDDEDYYQQPTNDDKDIDDLFS